MKKTLFSILIAAVAAAALAVAVSAAATDVIFDAALSVSEANNDPELLRDGSADTCVSFAPGGTLTVVTGSPATGIYIVFHGESAPWAFGAKGQATDGTNGTLREYREIPGAPVGALTLAFPDGAEIAEISLFSAGELPEHVRELLPREATEKETEAPGTEAPEERPTEKATEAETAPAAGNEPGGDGSLLLPVVVAVAALVAVTLVLILVRLRKR